MKHCCLALLAFALACSLTPAQAADKPESPAVAPENATASKQVFVLWPEGAPGALGTSSNDIPTLTAFFPKPELASGASMVICPGGGYGHLAPSEGQDYARWLNKRGVTGFVLKYRLGTTGYRHPAMLQDAARALRYVRAHAQEWKIDPKRIGIMGSSAGGHLASTLLTHFDGGKPDSSDPIERQSSRPDMGVLCYPVIDMLEGFGHRGSRNNLLGTNQPPELLRYLSSQLQVTPDTPPCFIWHTWEDKGVPVDNSLEFAKALRKNGVPFDLHVYQKGPHGLGLGNRDYDPTRWHAWTKDFRFWLKEQGWLLQK